jgi:uncharacterized protein YecE (DUF72 family)
MVVQLPPSFHCTTENARNATRTLTEVDRPETIAIEVRHESWHSNRATLQRLLRDADCIHVVDPVVSRPLDSGSTLYFRLHGVGRLRFRYSYSAEDFRRIRAVLEGLKPKRAYVMFNNLAMRADAARFASFLTSRP